ncbi:hypothetical protein ABZ570_26065 [Micromonospora sp. NPDC007271]|uniref:hypothetical protein n=1 Tax=Micromonospora sp. NPDC007271 TaxID=3154587 RepID=UPI0033D07D74
MGAGAAAVALALGLVGGLIGFAVGQPSPTEAGIAQMREANAKRDVEQIIELTEMARGTADQLSPILVAIKQDSDAGRTPEAAQVHQWQQTMRQLTEQFADPPSGTTATNVARGGLRSAVDQGTIAVDSVSLSITSPAPVRKNQLALAARQAALASVTWSIAAAQLDQINIDAGRGHQHVYLDAGDAEGAFTPDGAAESSDG